MTEASGAAKNQSTNPRGECWTRQRVYKSHFVNPFSRNSNVLADRKGRFNRWQIDCETGSASRCFNAPANAAEIVLKLSCFTNARDRTRYCTRAAKCCKRNAWLIKQVVVASRAKDTFSIRYRNYSAREAFRRQTLKNGVRYRYARSVKREKREQTCQPGTPPENRSIRHDYDKSSRSRKLETFHEMRREPDPPLAD